MAYQGRLAASQQAHDMLWPSYPSFPNLSAVLLIVRMDDSRAIARAAAPHSKATACFSRDLGRHTNGVKCIASTYCSLRHYILTALPSRRKATKRPQPHGDHVRAPRLASLR